MGPGQLSLYNVLSAYSVLDPEVSGIRWSLILHTKETYRLSFFLHTHMKCVSVPVGGLLPGPVLCYWSAAATLGGGRLLQHARISHVWLGAPPTIQA